VLIKELNAIEELFIQPWAALIRIPMLFAGKVGAVVCALLL
jgi:hypothetical protein